MNVDTLINADCIEFMENMSDECVPMTLTDIPYGEVNRDSFGIRNFDKGDADLATFSLLHFTAEVCRVTAGSIYIFCSTEQVSAIRKELVVEGFSTRLGIWEKTNPSPVNGQHIWLSGIECCVYGKKPGAAFWEHCKNPVWRYPTERTNKGRYDHPTIKPLALFRYLIWVSSRDHDVIFDPCIGSGTTAVAAILENRHYIGVDINKEYCDIAQRRIYEANAQPSLL